MPVPDELELTLRLIGRPDRYYEFALSILNRSGRTLLLPIPPITDLRFRRVADGEIAGWYTRMLLHCDWVGLVLGPGERRTIPLHAVVQAEPGPDDEGGAGDGIDDRWQVDLRPGPYDVSYRLAVDEDYHDGNSHYRIEHVRREAADTGAAAWVGEAISDTIRVEHE